MPLVDAHLIQDVADSKKDQLADWYKTLGWH